MSVSVYRHLPDAALFLKSFLERFVRQKPFSDDGNRLCTHRFRPTPVIEQNQGASPLDMVVLSSLPRHHHPGKTHRSASAAILPERPSCHTLIAMQRTRSRAQRITHWAHQAHRWEEPCSVAELAILFPSIQREEGAIRKLFALCQSGPPGAVGKALADASCSRRRFEKHGSSDSKAQLLVHPSLYFYRFQWP